MVPTGYCRFKIRDSYTEAHAAGNAIRFIYEDKVDVIFGSPNSLRKYKFQIYIETKSVGRKPFN